MPGNRLASVRNWVIYYGTDQSTPLEEYDLAVVAPEAWDAETVQAKQVHGTKMIAYISVLEVPMRPDRPAPADVLMIDGSPAEQTRWSNWILDPRKPGTAERLARIGSGLRSQKFDGFFLDTLGDVESSLLPMRLRSSIVPATGRLVAGLRAQFAEKLIIQNWGMGALLDLTLPFLDGLCWEDFPLGPAQHWQEELAIRLRRVSEQGTRVFALGHEEVAEARTAAQQHGFCWYGAPGSYIIYRARDER